jgi:hypothetical protein
MNSKNPKIGTKSQRLNTRLLRCCQKEKVPDYLRYRCHQHLMRCRSWGRCPCRLGTCHSDLRPTSECRSTRIASCTIVNLKIPVRPPKNVSTVMLISNGLLFTLYAQMIECTQHFWTSSVTHDGTWTYVNGYIAMGLFLVRTITYSELKVALELSLDWA